MYIQQLLEFRRRLQEEISREVSVSDAAKLAGIRAVLQETPEESRPADTVKIEKIQFIIDEAPGRARYLDAIDLADVESRLHERLAAQGQRLVQYIGRGTLADADAEEIVSEAIRRMLEAYTKNPTLYDPAGYFARIIRNLVHDYLREINRQEHRLMSLEPEQIQTAADQQALHEYQEQSKSAGAEDPAFRFAGNVFEIIDMEAQRLTEKEFLAITMKLASKLVKTKLTEEELARLLGWRRTAFRDALNRAKAKIRAYWKESIRHDG